MLTPDPNSDPARRLSIAIIGPDEARRSAIVRALAESWAAEESGSESGTAAAGRQGSAQEFCSYPFELDRALSMIEHRFHAVLVDLDGDSEYALEVVEKIASRTLATVMVYSELADREQVIRCMRAGAREFLSLPLAAGDMDGALARIPMRAAPLVAAAEITPQAAEPTAARGLYVFQGAKGGCGVTTVAVGFAMALARDSAASTLLIDLGAPLGDAALQLGLLNDYSIAHALEDPGRLDESFLRSLLARPCAGLWLLAGPGDYAEHNWPVSSIDKLLAVARQSFQNVVVDVGARIDLMESSLFSETASVYLVTEVGLSELRNAHRMLTQLLGTRAQRPQVVLNRYTSRALGFDDDSVAKALGQPARWKIPEEDGSGSRNRHTVAELTAEESAAFKAVRQMARAACGLPALAEKKKGFGLFGAGRMGAGSSAARAPEPEAATKLSLRLRA